MRKAAIWVDGIVIESKKKSSSSSSSSYSFFFILLFSLALFAVRRFFISTEDSKIDLVPTSFFVFYVLIFPHRCICHYD
jgi:hypothetical protein